MNSAINSNLKHAHDKAWKKVSADKSLPNIDVNVLINFLFDIFSGDKKKRAEVTNLYIAKFCTAFKTSGIAAHNATLAFFDIGARHIDSDRGKKSVRRIEGGGRENKWVAVWVNSPDF